LSQRGESKCIADRRFASHHGVMNNIVAVAPRPARLSSKLRAAIDARVNEGLSIVEACTKAGMSRQGWHKAMKRPAVRDHLEDVQRRFVLEAESKRSHYRVRAFEVALDLMLNAKSEAVRARMAEFLAGDGKAPQVAVHIDARQEPNGYEFRRPGQRVVEISDGLVEPQTTT
jgi:hypothetical protein